MAPDSNINLQPDTLDTWLDKALHQYGDVEPRAGLENRILANLESTRNLNSSRWALIFAVAALATACIAIVFWFGASTHQTQRSVVAVTPTPALTTADATQHTQSLRPAVHVVAHRRIKRKVPQLAAAFNEPRLPQFPSPRPLTKEEQMLQQYVTELPQEAVLIARAQAERREELNTLFARESSKRDSDQ